MLRGSNAITITLTHLEALELRKFVADHDFLNDVAKKNAFFYACEKNGFTEFTGFEVKSSPAEPFKTGADFSF